MSAILLSSTPAFQADSSDIAQHQIKAAALHDILTFTAWPASVFETADSPLVLGVLGQGPIATVLAESIASESWHGRRVRLRRLASVAEARSCQVLFIARSEHLRWPSIRKQLGTLPILTVSDAENFAREGGIIQFATERNHLKLTVNLAVARRCGLSLSSKLLRLAEIIDGTTP